MTSFTRVIPAGLELGLRLAEEVHGTGSRLLHRKTRRQHDIGDLPDPPASRLAAILEQAEQDLAGNVLPFWARHAADLEQGGFITHLDRAGRRLGPTDKYLVTQARLIWTLSAAHRHGLTGQGYLELAARGVRFLIDHMWDDEHGGFVWSVSRDGTPIDSRKLLYGQAFAIYGLAEYAMAAADRSALSRAEATVEILQRRARDGGVGFREQFAPDWTPAPGSAGLRKTLNVHMHLMEALTPLFEASPSAANAATLRELIDIVLTRAIDSQDGCAREIFEAAPAVQWRRRIGVSYGHGVETAWLVLRSADVLGDDREPLRRPVLGLIDHALAYGFDHARGGLARYGPPAGNVRHAVYLGRDRLTKHWWEQAEMLVALIEAHRWTRQPAYWSAFEKQFDWIWRHQIDREGGEWFAATSWRDGRPLGFDKGDDWKCAYHGARALMEVSRRLRGTPPTGRQTVGTLTT